MGTNDKHEEDCVEQDDSGEDPTPGNCGKCGEVVERGHQAISCEVSHY